MPAKSKSQQRLFGMVHAYQKGKMKHAPSKIKSVASDISPTAALHFAATKTSKLPKRVKKADMDTQAFERGFLKAALDNGIKPLDAVAIMKQALDMATITNYLKDPANAKMVGAGAGALAGGLGGAAVAGKGNRLAGGLLGAAGGGALGYGAGSSEDLIKKIYGGGQPGTKEVGEAIGNGTYPMGEDIPTAWGQALTPQINPQGGQAPTPIVPNYQFPGMTAGLPN